MQIDNDIIRAGELILENEGGMDCIFECAYGDLKGMSQEEIGIACGKSIPVISRKKANNKRLIAIVQAWILREAAQDMGSRLIGENSSLKLETEVVADTEVVGTLRATNSGGFKIE